MFVVDENEIGLLDKLFFQLTLMFQVALNGLSEDQDDGHDTVSVVDLRDHVAFPATLVAEANEAWVWIKKHHTRLKPELEPDRGRNYYLYHQYQEQQLKILLAGFNMRVDIWADFYAIDSARCDNYPAVRKLIEHCRTAVKWMYMTCVVEAVELQEGRGNLMTLLKQTVNNHPQLSHVYRKNADVMKLATGEIPATMSTITAPMLQRIAMAHELLVNGTQEEIDISYEGNELLTRYARMLAGTFVTACHGLLSFFLIFTNNRIQYREIPNAVVQENVKNYLRIVNLSLEQQTEMLNNSTDNTAHLFLKSCEGRTFYSIHEVSKYIRIDAHTRQ